MDLNGDGIQDIISGSWTPGDLFLFTGNANGTFNSRQALKDKSGKCLNAGTTTTIFAADWDGDADLDLIVGNIKGEVHWIANESEGKALVFGIPIHLKAGDKPLYVLREAGPCVADWDGDGYLDLIVGDEEGTVTLFRNTATQGLPQLATGKTLVAKGNPKNPNDGPGIRAKVCVADWNEDGHLDLLLGDYRQVFDYREVLDTDQKITEAQRSEIDGALTAINKAIHDMDRLDLDVRQDFMVKLGLINGQKLNEQQKLDLHTELSSMHKNSEEYRALESGAGAQGAILGKYKRSTTDRIGHVWVYLRKPAEAAVMEADAQRSDGM